MSKPIRDLMGQQFGRLTVIKFLRTNKNKKAVWLCQCSCENHVLIEVVGNNLLNGQKSCGCINNERLYKEKYGKTHGLRNHPLYIIWHNMKERCYNKNFLGYKNYGGRGITVCDEWKNNFQIFYDWSIANHWEKGINN